MDTGVSPVIGFGYTWGTATTDHRGWELDLTTGGGLSVGYRF